MTRPTPTDARRDAVALEAAKATYLSCKANDAYDDHLSDMLLLVVSAYNAALAVADRTSDAERVREDAVRDMRGAAAEYVEYALSRFKKEVVLGVRAISISPREPGAESEKRFLHKRRGTTYQLVGHAKAQQTSEPILDMTDMVVYRSEHDGSLWVRPAAEFNDGRFEELTAPPAMPTRAEADAERELVALEGDDVVIRITLPALVYASEQGCLCTFSQSKNDFRTVKVHDPRAWRDAIVRALRREKENGDTPVHLMLDAALEYAADQGEEGITIEEVLPAPPAIPARGESNLRNEFVIKQINALSHYLVDHGLWDDFIATTPEYPRSVSDMVARDEADAGDTCEVCGGDCASANPPVMNCPRSAPPSPSKPEDEADAGLIETIKELAPIVGKRFVPSKPRDEADAGKRHPDKCDEWDFTHPSKPAVPSPSKPDDEAWVDKSAAAMYAYEGFDFDIAPKPLQDNARDKVRLIVKAADIARFGGDPGEIIAALKSERELVAGGDMILVTRQAANQHRQLNRDLSQKVDDQSAGIAELEAEANTLWEVREQQARRIAALEAQVAALRDDIRNSPSLAALRIKSGSYRESDPAALQPGSETK